MKKINAFMYKNLPLTIAAIAVVFAGIGFLGVSAFSGKSSSRVGTTATPTKPATPIEQLDMSCDGVCVNLTSEGADPDTIAIPVGTFVQFNSKDGKTHSLSLGAGGSDHDHSGPFSSGDFQADEAWRVQFKERGTFQFHDHFDPDLNILVVVYEEGADYRIEN